MSSEKCCPKCKEVKYTSEFFINRSKKDGFSSYCKPCQKKAIESHYKRNLAHKEHRARKNRERYASDPKYRQKVLDKYKRKYHNNPLFKARRAEAKYSQDKVRLQKEPLFKLKLDTRRLIGSYIKKKGLKKGTRTEALLGCSFEEFKEHIEKQFKPGMTWERRNKWHIDHIIPLATAKTEEEVIRLNHYTNLQPLWAEENLRKGAKLPDEKDK